MDNAFLSFYAFSRNALVNGELKLLDPAHGSAKAVLSGGSLMVPYAFFKYVADVSRIGQTVRIRRDGHELHLTKGCLEATLDGGTCALSAAPRLEKGLLYLPLTDCLRALGMPAKQWDLFAVAGDEDEIRKLDASEEARLSLSQKVCGIYNAAYFTRADFAKARESWRENLCGSKLINDVSVPGMKRLLELRDEDSEDLRHQMHRESDACILFGDKPPVESADLKVQYDCVLRMAQPYGTYGCRGYKDKALLEDIVFAMDWMHDHMYGAKVLSDESYRSYKIFNWWEWYVGGACPMMDIVMIIERDISRELVKKYVLPIQFIATQSRVGLEEPLVMSQVISLIPLSLLTEDRAMLQSMYLGMNKLLRKHETGDCMRSDWCCMTHNFPYNICYGLCNLDRVAKLLRILSASPLAFPCLDTYNLMHMARYTFSPVVFEGQGINMMNGRYMQNGAVEIASSVLGAIHNLYGLFGDEEDNELYALLRRNATPAIKESLIAHFDQHMTLEEYRRIAVPHIASYPANVRALNGPSSAVKYTLGYMWASGDCGIQFRRDYCFALRMSSERLGGYESINSANGDAWYTGDGMLYLYTPDYAQYDAPWWKGVNKYHMPGVTADTQERLNASIRYGHEYKNERDFVGGTDLDKQFLTAAMDFRSFHCEKDYQIADDGYGRSQPLHYCTLQGRKAWFLMDKAAVALGCDISAGDGFEVHTTIDNRLLQHPDDPVTINGDVVPPRQETIVYPSVKALHIAGVGGYVFPEPVALSLRFTDREEGRFVECWINHGVNPANEGYAYIVLPLYSEEETARYAQAPDIEILNNNQEIQAARERSSGLCGYVFRKPGTCGALYAENPMIVMTHDLTDGRLSLSACDPTQKQAAIALRVEGAASVVSCDEAMEAEVGRDVSLKIACTNSHGKGFKAELAAK